MWRLNFPKILQKQNIKAGNYFIRGNDRMMDKTYSVLIFSIIKWQRFKDVHENHIIEIKNWWKKLLTEEYNHYF